MAHIDPTPDPHLDAQLELKKRARRRLVGAAALALLAAIVLPMVMDREPMQPAQDIQIRIPSQDRQDGGFTSRILPAKPATTPLPPAEPAPMAVAKPEAPPPATPKPEPKQETKPEPPKVVAPPSPKPDQAVKPPAGGDEEARAKAVLDGDAAGGSGGEQWAVQLGAYREAANVKQLVAKIKEMGLPVYTEPFNSPGGPRTRVRAGPFPSRDAAERAQARIKTIGVSGPVARK